ncbi:hypothetical protein ACEQ8H_001774 [Pleosporales sp. CAS-2024a]
MALATLYSRARQTNVTLPKAHAFIVDHKARPESTGEAAWVLDQLRSKLDMSASILTLAWPESLRLSDMRSFETVARTLRYRALGRACRDLGVKALMLAHHGDDQAETVLMRLANNRLRTGLKGMQNVEWIPECEGIHGVHHSGKDQSFVMTDKMPFPVEQGGIQILRPLLSVEKSRLIATCQEQGIAWVEDTSNQMKTLTSRNAIRHLYSACRLPEALSIPSIVSLSLHMQKRVAAHREYAKMLFNQCLLRLDIQTGMLLVRFPPFESLLGRPILTKADKSEARDNACCMLERVADLVTPNSKPGVGQLAARVDDIYPEFMTPEEKEKVMAAGESHFRDKFTVYHIWWRQWDKASPFEEHGIPSDDYSSTAPHPREWLLTRQALEQGEGKRLEVIVPPSHSSELSQSQQGYQLVDGRFWIQIRNYTDDTLVIRVFDKTDMRHLPTTQANKSTWRHEPGPIPERFITSALTLLSPSDIRFTLPAVFRKDSTTGDESLVGFPTLNVSMRGLSPPAKICDWHVRYKKIDFGQHAIDDIITSGITMMDVINQDKVQRYANKGLRRLKFPRRRAIGGDAGDMTGYKRMYEESDGGTEGERQKTVHYTLSSEMKAKEVDGLEFLRPESERQDRRRSKRRP